jgi:hypothetical protein
VTAWQDGAAGAGAGGAAAAGALPGLRDVGGGQRQRGRVGDAGRRRRHRRHGARAGAGQGGADGGGPARVAGGARRRAHPGVLPRLPGKYVTPVQPVRLRPFNFRINLRHSGNTETFLLNWQTHRSVPFHRAQMHRH